MTRIRVNRTYTLDEIQNLLDRNTGDYVVLEFNNTLSLNSYVVDRMMSLRGSNRLQIRIIGGYDDQRISNYPHYRNRFLNDNTYTLNEMKKIYYELEEIEKGINPNWDELQKLMYFIGYLKNRIIYHPFFETAPSKDIRSLTGLFSGKTVCAGFALILKEICDRNGIYCQYVEGASDMDKINAGWATHSWNIVRIKGQLIPVDLTWNATANNSGKMLDNSELFNVNQFVKSHIPLKHEQVQNYRRELKSIDGAKVGVINSFINKDIRYEHNAFYGRRSDGSRYEITLVGQFIENNVVVYRYYYQNQRQSGTKDKPLILYSTFNISNVIHVIKRIDKMKNEIREAYNRRDYTKAHELEEKIREEKVKYLYDSNDLCDELLLSNENVRQAVVRGDFFIGSIGLDVNSRGNREVKGVFVDTDFAKQIGLSQKSCRRSDGSAFIIEDYGKIKLGGNLEVYRYRIYEQVIRDGRKMVIKNTVFADQDLFTDNRQALYDDFLNRRRLDRKTREANGYLGYYSKEGIRTYSTPVRDYFNQFCKRLTISNQDIRDYYNEITLSEMARLVKTYEPVNGYYRNRTSKRTVTDKDLELRVKFSYLWLFAAGVSHDRNDPKGLYGYNQAFGSQSEDAFKLLSGAISESMNTNGNIDPVKILMNLKQQGKYPEYELLLVRLFSSEEATRIINKLYRLQNPSALRERGDIEFFRSGRMINAELLVERRKRLEAAKTILEVYRDSNGNVNTRRAR